MNKFYSDAECLLAAVDRRGLFPLRRERWRRGAYSPGCFSPLPSDGAPQPQGVVGSAILARRGGYALELEGGAGADMGKTSRTERCGRASFVVGLPAVGRGHHTRLPGIRYPVEGHQAWHVRSTWHR